MGIRCSYLLLLSLAVVLLGIFMEVSNAALQQCFYQNTCPQAEQLIRNLTWSTAETDPALGAKLLRVHFHDCFVRGCDGSILLDTVGNSSSEKEAIPNRSLGRFEVIDFIKAQVEEACPGVVSCADILALSARDAVSFPFQKPMWNVLTGRRDGVVSLQSEVAGNIPSPFDNFTTLLNIFSQKGLNLSDLVALSGAHTIGRAHCAAFSRRLNFTGNGDVDPSLDPVYAETLKTLCPNPPNPNTTVEMDPHSSLSFDRHYYAVVKQHKGLFQSDAALLDNNASAKLVNRMVSNGAFYSRFATSMINMGNVQVLTGSDGEIRKNCRVVNPGIQMSGSGGPVSMESIEAAVLSIISSI